MSRIEVRSLSYAHPGGESLFSNINFSIPAGAIWSLIGNNGTGKTTLLRILAGEAPASQGNIFTDGKLWYVPQQFGIEKPATVAQALGICHKLKALNAILSGDICPDHYDNLDEDWEIESRLRLCLDEWDLEHVGAGDDFTLLSGGERTRVLLAGIDLHHPSILLLDEPTNHLDRPARLKLIEKIRSTTATVLLVSHDRELLRQVEHTMEISPAGIKHFGGDYDLYHEVETARKEALNLQVSETEKQLGKSLRIRNETLRRQSHRTSRAPAKAKSEGIPRIMMNTLRNRAENSTVKLTEAHDRKIENLRGELSRLRIQTAKKSNIKIAVEASGNRTRMVFSLREVNHDYSRGNLWLKPVSVDIPSGARVAITGRNGSGKTTLTSILTGSLAPSSGSIYRTNATILYIDQQYSAVNTSRTVGEYLSDCNTRNHPLHFLRMEIARYSLEQKVWERPCCSLSGGEKMKLLVCSLEIREQMPDVMILDEPANNLDLESLDILTSAVKSFKGTVIVISHDIDFLDSVGITDRIDLDRFAGSENDITP